MTNLINRLLAKFNLKLVSTKPDTRLVKESVKFLDQHKDYWNDDIFFPPYVGDINYVQEKVEGEFPQVSGEIYYKSASEKYFCDYNGDETAPFEKMYETTTFTEQELQNKLNGECEKDL